LKNIGPVTSTVLKNNFRLLTSAVLEGRLKHIRPAYINIHLVLKK